MQVSRDVDADYTEGNELTYLRGVAVDTDTAAPNDLEAIEVEARTWVVFRTSGEYPRDFAGGVCGVSDRMVPVESVAARSWPVDRGGDGSRPGFQ